jgi:hypothetical protein
MSKTIKTIDLGEIIVSATINGQSVNLVAGKDLTVTLNGNIEIDLEESRKD